jgi:glycosyltransferase involved in cell wall biosynthesis
MKIAINGWFLAHDAHTGTGQYVRALVEWLPRVAPQHTYVVVTPQTVEVAAPVQNHVMRVGGGALSKVCFEQQLFPQACKTLTAQIAHIPYWAPPLASPVPFVVTIHDLIPLLLPEYARGWRVRLYNALVQAATPGAALILADSNASRDDILKHFAIPAERVRTVYLAAGPHYTPQGDWQVDEPIRAKYGLNPEGGYVLYLGGFDQRKNVRGLLSAWTWAASSIGENYPLVLAGALPEPDGALFEDLRAIARELKVADTAKFIGPVAEEDKPALYRGATVFAYLSRYEGFGLPPLEAMACGVPVVVSNRASLPEVVGSAGYILPPDDTRTIGASILTPIVEPAVYDDLRARSLAQTKQFTWEKTANETVAAYETVGK